jgi:hypothetical protein
MARIISGKITVGNLIAKLEKQANLPAGTIQINQPSGRHVRRDISLSKLRKRLTAA